MLINEIIDEGRKKKKKKTRSNKKSRTPRIYGAWWGGYTGDGGDSGADVGGGIEETRTLKKFLEASGYIPSESQRRDPRFSSALTGDITPNSIRQNADKLSLGKIRRDGRPPLARTSGKF